MTDAVAEARRSGAATVTEEHLLLALLSRPGTVAEVLTDHGVTYGTAEAGLAA